MSDECRVLQQSHVAQAPCLAAREVRVRWGRTAGAGILAVCLAARVEAQTPALVIENVTVISMTDSIRRPNQTVLVRGDTVVAVGSAASVPVPPQAVRIDGAGRFLIPGLHDLYTHVHEWSLDLFIAHGVTTVRNTAPGRLAHVALRDEVAAGRRVGPRIVTTGPVLDGIEPSYASAGSLRLASEAVRIVEAQRRTGYDGVMVYVGIEPMAYLAVLDAARRAGLPVTGHLPWKLPRELVFTSGQRSKDNLIGEVNTETGEAFVPEVARDADAAAIARSGLWTIPTLTIHKARARKEDAMVLASLPELRFVPPRQRVHWMRSIGRLVAAPRYVYSGAPDLVRRLHRAGGRILLGTDAGYPFVVHGVSIHDELRNLVEAGLTPWEALRAGTAEAARFLGTEARSGTIAVGKQADLVLLNADPLLDVSNTERIGGVVVRGRWFSAHELRSRVERVVADTVRDRLRELPEVPCQLPAACVSYDISAGGRVIGEERVSMIRSGGRLVRLSAQSSVDEHLATRTQLTYVRLPNSTEQLTVDRWMAGARSGVTLSRKGGSITVESTIGRERDRWVTSVSRDAILGGPLHGVNADLDLTASLQLLMEAARPVPVAGAVLLESRRAELNEEEHGREGVVGETWYRVQREADDASGLRRYRILVQGPNGSGFSAIRVTMGADGCIAQVETEDGYLRVTRRSVLVGGNGSQRHR